MLVEKGFYVFRKRGVGVYAVVGRIAMVSGVDGIDWSFKDAREGTK